ncbi:MAG: Rrf2 family transcriptional regulator [Gammaproteobacteria bacterium]|jgi:Rrf2 family iron-sulfur cluster assembly transcriptional regulator|nr:Rrf2 family transcriptional regulator [Gammaproteobacteria bacterium]
MKLSTKSRYAITAMIDLAQNQDGAVSLKDISDRQSISLSYLEQLFCKLKNFKVVTSRRGPGGGYVLNKKSSEISLHEIITAVEENMDQTQCGGSMNCNKEKPCTTHNVWTGLNKIISDYMKNITIEDVISNQVIHSLHDARESDTHVS